MTNHHRLSRFMPFLRWWPLVNRHTLRGDLVAGLTGAIIVLPQGIAFAIIAGLPPEWGLYSAMIPPVVAALFGSSHHLVSGPSTPMSIVIYATISTLALPGTPDYLQWVLTVTFLTGFMQLALGLAGFGTMVNFISPSVVLGFTSGAAFLILASQIKNFFGIPITSGAPFAEVVRELLSRSDQVNPYITTVSLVTLLTGLLFRRLAPRFPYMIMGILAGSGVAMVLNHVFGATVTEIPTVGAMPAHLAPFSLPDLSLKSLYHAVSPALAITILGLTGAISSARLVALRSGQRIDGNQEFIGQGLANLVGSFFTAYASSGSFNRTGLNYDAGARTPMAAIFAALFLAVIVLTLAPMTAYLPNAAMAGVLFLVAWRLLDPKRVQTTLHTNRVEGAILAGSFLATLLLDLKFAIFVGVFLSLSFHLKRAATPEMRPMIPDVTSDRRCFVDTWNYQQECSQMRILRLEGPLFFGAVDSIQQAFAKIDEADPHKKHLLLLMSSVYCLDLAASEMLTIEAQRRQQLGGGLYLCGLKPVMLQTMGQGNFLRQIGTDHFFPHKSEALVEVIPRLDQAICGRCPSRIFQECPPQSVAG